MCTPYWNVLAECLASVIEFDQMARNCIDLHEYWRAYKSVEYAKACQASAPKSSQRFCLCGTQ